MRLKFLFTVAFMFAACCGNAQGNKEMVLEGWILVGQGSDSSIYFIKEKPVTNDDGVVKIWIQLFSPQKKVKGKNYSNVKTMMLQEYDCEGRRSQLISVIVYNSKKEIIENLSLQDYETKWTDIVPESIGEMLLEKICDVFNRGGN